MDLLRDYLKRVGATKMPAPLLACELCGSFRFDVLRDTVVVRGSVRAPVRVAACAQCGLLFQVDRLSSAVYERYYAERYRWTISDAIEPDESFLQDQLTRGEHLYRQLSPILTEPGRILDVGCGAGGLLVAFAQRGWDVEGMDPDHRAVALGKRRFGLRLSAGIAESMTIPDRSIDLILITGSLEHVSDLDRTMSHCVRVLRPGGRILVEGWGLAQARIIGGFGHNQKRYFTGASFRQLFARHRISTEFVTNESMCGPTRPGSVFAMGIAGPRPPNQVETIAVHHEDGCRTLSSDELHGLGIH